MEIEKFLTKFEKTRVLGQRAEQISRGAPPMVDITGIYDALEIAEKELFEKKIPINIIRTYSDGTKEVISVNDLHDLT